MAIIYSYPLNDNIKSLDELVGTTEKTINGQLKTVTRNFLLADLAEFLIVDGGLQKTIILTTDGDSGPSTLDQVTGVLNIPQYLGVTDLGYVASAINGIVTSSTGLDAIIPLANSINAGLLSPVNFTILSNTSGINTGDQNLQSVTDIGATTTKSITANSFIKQGGTGTNILLDNGNTVALSSIVGNTNLSTSQTATNFIINSDTGTDASVPLGNGTLAGATLNDYTTTEKNKLAGIEAGAEVNVNADWNAVSGDAQILNKPIIPSIANLVPYTGANQNVSLGVNNITATKLIKQGGTSAQLLAANGDTITAGTNITINGGQISSTGGAGGSSSVSFYLNGSIASNVAGYKQMSTTAVIGVGTDFTLTGNGTIAQFLTSVGSPNRLEIPAGAWNFELWLQSSVNNSGTKVHVELYKYDTIFTLIASGVSNPIALQANTNINLYLTNIAIPQTTLLVTDRLAVRVIATNSLGVHSVTLHTEDSNLCEVLTNFVGGITAINGITQPSQTLATGATGTNFAIVSSGSTHTFNLPDAGTVARGVVTTNNQSFAGLKTFTDNIIVNGININKGNNDAVANIAIGLDTLDNITGNQNTVIGYQAASNDNITPLALSFNTVLGYQAYGNGAANNNTAIGWQSLFSSAANNNSALGYSSGLLLTTGFQNTFIGSFAGGFTGQKIDAQNSTAIGYQAITTKNNQVVLGNSLITETVLNGNIVIDLPTTSTAGTYSFLTRNTASGVIEKLLVTSVQTAITLGAIGSSPNANGATLTAGGSLVLQPASGAFGGVITTGAQTIAGNKTFTGTTAGITKTMVGLSNVDNTSDLLKPISTATQTALNLKVDSNTAITGDTKTKITYDTKGLVTAGADATTADIADSINKRYVTDANLTVIGNTSGTNTGDNATNTQYSGLATSKQDTLQSTVNIKSINGNSILGSGDLTISGGGSSSQSAFTILANNTNATAVPTEQVYKDVAEQTNLATASTISWNGTAPTNPISLNYKWNQIGSLVTVRFNLVYTTAGATNSILTITLPTDMPVPATISGFTSANDVQCYGTGVIFSSKALSTVFNVTAFRRNATNTGYEFVIIRSPAGSFNSAQLQFTYYTL